MKGKTRFAFIAAGVFAAALGLSFAGGRSAFAQQTPRAKQVGARMMCMCGCSQILTQCNHVGCTTSAGMLKKLDQIIARNESDDLTLQSFVQEYGPSVLAEPPTKGFSGVAWFITPAAAALGLGIVVLVIVHWRRRVVAVPVAAPGAQVSPESLARAIEKVDEETED